jgi:phage gpG-like protein
MPGDDARLSLFTKQLRALTSAAGRRSIVNALAEEAIAQTQLGFAESRDPYGRSWEPLKLRVGGKPLLDRGRLRASIAKEVSASGFRLGSNLIYARVHQYGATIRPVRAKALRFRGVSYRGGRRKYSKWIFAKKVVIPRRQYIPEGRLGPIWSKAFAQAARRAMFRILQG